MLLALSRRASLHPELTRDFADVSPWGPWKPEAFLILVCGYAMLGGEMKRKTTKSPAAQKALDCPAAKNNALLRGAFEMAIASRSAWAVSVLALLAAAGDRSANLSLWVPYSF
jgi:hypothetical protein